MFPGQGAQARHGPGAARRLPGGARRVRGGRRRAGRAAVRADLRGPGRAPDPDRQRPAGPDGDLARGRARGRGADRAPARRARRATSPATAWASTRRWPRPVRSASPTRRACCGCAARRCRTAVPAGEGAMAAILGADVPTVEAVAAEAAAEGGVCELANDNGEGQQVHLRQRGRRRARGRARQGARAHGAACCCRCRAPFHCALMAPAAERLAAGAGRRPARAPGGAGDRQRHGRAGPGPRRDPRAAGAAGDRARALAREHGHDGAPGRRTR